MRMVSIGVLRLYAAVEALRPLSLWMVVRQTLHSLIKRLLIIDRHITSWPQCQQSVYDRPHYSYMQVAIHMSIV
jgi:hypothetical protein